jgi:hypothetical protein
MAGFPKWRGSYDVPRTRIPIKEWWPGGIDFIVSRLFPNHQEWISQAVHEYEGDGSDAAMNFLYDLIPFMSEVIVQDGCFWIQQYPTHTVSTTLLNALPPDYVQKAHQARQWCRQTARQAELSSQTDTNFRTNVLAGIGEVQQ